MRRIRIQRTRNNLGVFRRNASGISGLCKMLLAPFERQRQIALHNARLEKLQQDREIGEIILGIQHNKLLLQDIEIEKRKLELKKLQRELGELSPEGLDE